MSKKNNCETGKNEQNPSQRLSLDRIKNPKSAQSETGTRRETRPGPLKRAQTSGTTTVGARLQTALARVRLKARGGIEEAEAGEGDTISDAGTCGGEAGCTITRDTPLYV